MTDPAVYTAKEVAALCRVSEWTVGEWTRTGVLPRLPTRRLRIPARAVHALLSEGYYANRGEPNGQEASEAKSPRRRIRSQADGSLASQTVGSDRSLARPIGPAQGDVVVRVVEGRSR